MITRLWQTIEGTACTGTPPPLIRRRQPFIAETVFNHPSKLELSEDAHAKGFFVALHVVLVPLELALVRVPHRVAAGGHDVPPEKIRGRFERLWPLVADAIYRCDVTHVWDNSRYDGPVEVAQLALGILDGACAWPPWAPRELTSRWPS